MAIANAVTGSPIVDCDALWSSASGGREPRRRWPSGASTGRQLVAMVRPLRLGPPRSVRGLRWASVGSLLGADGLSDRNVQVSASSGSASSGCRPIVASVLGPSRTFGAHPIAGGERWPNHGECRQPTAEPVPRGQPAPEQHCSAVPAATRLWIRLARAAGYRQATLAWWHRVNASSRTGDGRHYTPTSSPPPSPPAGAPTCWSWSRAVGRPTSTWRASVPRRARAPPARSGSTTHGKSRGARPAAGGAAGRAPDVASAIRAFRASRRRWTPWCTRSSRSAPERTPAAGRATGSCTGTGYRSGWASS